MKLLIAGDIHGSAYYCEKLLALFEKLGAEKLVLTGDILYHGPRNDLPEGHAPKKVIEMLCPLSEKILCVRGNCEAEVDQMVLSFPCLAEYIMIFDGKRQIFLSHGHIHNPQNMPPLPKGSVLVNGHTHIPAFEKIGDITYINPGSVSIPKPQISENSANAVKKSEHGCILLENDTVKFYTLDGEIYYEGRLD